MEQLEQFKEKIDDKKDELQQVSAQLEISKREKLNIEMQMETTVKQLEEEREELQVSDMCCISVVKNELHRILTVRFIYSQTVKHEVLIRLICEQNET